MRKCGAEAEGCAEDHGDTRFREKRCCEGFVRINQGSLGRCLADEPCNRRVNVKCAFGLGAGDAFAGVQHIDHKIATAGEDCVVLGNEVMAAVERFKGGPLAIEFGFEVDWDWILRMAPISSTGPAA